MTNRASWKSQLNRGQSRTATSKQWSKVRTTPINTRSDSLGRMSWKLNTLACSWMHPSGLTVLMDPNPTRSGAIRCVGPFGTPSNEGDGRDVLVLMADLTLLLEKGLSEDQYVAWGTYRSWGPHQEHNLPLLGRDYFFTPNIALRSEILDLSTNSPQKSECAREWTVNVEEFLVTHRSGITFKLAPRCASLIGHMTVGTCSKPLDSGLFHPATMKQMLRRLAQTAMKLLLDRKAETSIRIGIPLVSFTKEIEAEFL